MKLVAHIALLLVGMVSTCAHAGLSASAEIQSLDVSPQGSGLKVELRLSSSVAARVEVARNPDRLVLELPNTATAKGQSALAVDRNGVQRIRVGLHQMRPPASRVVVDMDGPHPYLLTTSGNTVILTILPIPEGQVTDTRPWFGKLMRRQPRIAQAGSVSSGAGAASALVVTP